MKNLINKNTSYEKCKSQEKYYGFLKTRLAIECRANIMHSCKQVNTIEHDENV